MDLSEIVSNTIRDNERFEDAQAIPVARSVVQAVKDGFREYGLDADRIFTVQAEWTPNPINHKNLLRVAFVIENPGNTKRLTLIFNSESKKIEPYFGFDPYVSGASADEALRHRTVIEAVSYAQAHEVVGRVARFVTIAPATDKIVNAMNLQGPVVL